MSERKKITRAAGVMSGATMLSRIAGLVRDMMIAGLFGAGFGTDAFFMAFTIPNLLRRFFAEGSLTAAFVPTFSEIYHRRGMEEAKRVASICLTLLVLVMAGITLVGMVASPLVVKGIGFGFGAVEGKLALTAFLNRIMFPYIFFVSLLALLTGVLNVLGHYFLPALSPVFLNLAMILCGWQLAPYFGVPITALAVGVLVGGLVQLLIQLPVLGRMGVGLRPDFAFRDPAVVGIAKLMLPGIAGVAIYQVNVVVTRLLASFLPEGSVSYLYYGQRLFEFPQGIFIAALAQAVLPAMSRQAALGNEEGVKESLRFALALIVVVTLPASVGLVLCAVPVYSLFFMSGQFSYHDVQQAALALVAYAPGLLFLGVSRVVVPAFYSLKDTRTPVLISFWTLLANVLFGLLLMKPLAHTGLALALSLSSVFNAILLLWSLRRKVGPIGLGSALGSLARVLPAAGAMAVVVWGILRLAPWDSAEGDWLKALVLCAALAAGVGVYGLGCLAMRVPEAGEAAAMLKRKLWKKSA